ncbi:MAG: hypothetical protein ACYTKD_09590 [Planctomycetota bacterium]
MTSVPQTIVIGRDGRLKAAHVGDPAGRTDRLEKERATELEVELERELEALVAPMRVVR